MKYYKNTEIAALFHVSEKAVRNWVEATQQGKLNLELYERSSRFMIANTSRNMQIIEELVNERKKFKNSRGHKTVSPNPEFYKLFTIKEATDIILNIDLHNELPIQYSYFDGGAEKWAEYVDRLLKEEAPNTTKSTIKLLDQCFDFIEDLVGQGSRKINIVDLGVGDASPVRGFIKSLLDKDLLNKYIAVDLSADMLKIAERNINTWFDGRVVFEGYKRDITYELFKDLTIEETYASNGSPLNVVLLLGGTLSNLRIPSHTLRLINNSMTRDDMLLYSLKTDTETSRRYFDFRTGSESKLGAQLRLVPELLGIDESMYDVEQYFDEVQKARFTRIKLKIAMTILFEFDGLTKKLELHKGKTILLWRVKHRNALEVIEQFDENGFDLLHASTADDKNYLLTISSIKTGQIS